MWVLRSGRVPPVGRPASTLFQEPCEIMPVTDSASQMALGFLTAWEHCDQGLVGGYLLLNPLGRPLEFHCTSPLKPNRAQQILYGPTLKPYLYGEQIGQTLVAKASIAPLVVCTDEPSVMSVRDWISLPVALVHQRPADREPPDGEARDEAEGRPSHYRLDASHGQSGGFHWRSNLLSVADGHEGDQAVIETCLAGLENFDLAEPFERIRQAIDEAHRAART